jgi:hypothetical protein
VSEFKTLIRSIILINLDDDLLIKGIKEIKQISFLKNDYINFIYCDKNKSVNYSVVKQLIDVTREAKFMTTLWANEMDLLDNVIFKTTLYEFVMNKTELSILSPFNHE